MSVINLQLDNNLLTKTNDVIIASGASGTHTCEFTFDESWEGYIKTAVFYQSKDSIQYAVLDTNNICMIPANAMQYKGIMSIGVFGVKGDDILSSTVERVEILEGATDSDVDLEPSDDVFLAIVSSYHAMLTKCETIDQEYADILDAIEAQNAILETLNAFDVTGINERMDEIEADTSIVKALGEEFEKNFRINNVTIQFDSNGEYKYYDERITPSTLCDVFFNTLSVAAASAAIVSVESFTGYIRFKTTYTCSDILTCDIYCMGV